MLVDEILKNIRKELNISQETLARDLNVSFATLNRWENNRVKPSRLAKMRIREYCSTKKLSKEILSDINDI